MTEEEEELLNKQTSLLTSIYGTPAPWDDMYSSLDLAFDDAWERSLNRPVKSCTCGSEITYGKGSKHHSDWCDLYEE